MGCGAPAEDPDASTAATGTTGTTGTPTAGTPTAATSDTTSGTTTGGTGTTGGVTGCISGTAADGSLAFPVDPANNYAFDSTVTLHVKKIAPNSPLNFDWSALTVDIQEQPMTPGTGDVVTVLLALLKLTKDEFEAKLNANENLVNYSKGALAFYPTTETSANIYDFTAPGATEPLPAEEIDPYLDPVTFPPETHTYALLVQNSTEPAHGVRMVQALQIDPNEVTTDISVTNDSSSLVYSTDLTTVLPVQVPAANANITVDWKPLQEVALNGLGDLWTERQIDEVMVAQYSLSPEELTQQFLSLEKISDQMFRGPVLAGASLNLSTLTEETSGAPFTGIDANGTWILALKCTKCTNPAPWFLTILKTCQ